MRLGATFLFSTFSTFDEEVPADTFFSWIRFNKSFFNDLPAWLDAFLGHELGQAFAFFGAVSHLGRCNEGTASALANE